MKFNINEDKPINEIRHEIGWWEHKEGKDFSELVAVCMILCSKIDALENKIKKIEDTIVKTKLPFGFELPDDIGGYVPNDEN